MCGVLCVLCEKGREKALMNFLDGRFDALDEGKKACGCGLRESFWAPRPVTFSGLVL